MISGVDRSSDPESTLAAIRVQAAMVRANAFELEQLGLTLSGRDVASLDQDDLVSYLVWISLLTSHTAQVLAAWGVALVACAENTVLAAELTRGTTAVAAAETSSAARRARRWRWRV